MKKMLVIVALWLFVFLQLKAQTDHWEMVARASDDWKYLVPDAATGSLWCLPAYNDSGWPQGPGGIGYGNPDCSTLIPEGSLSVYVRKNFLVEDKDKISLGQLNIMFDDGFVAYLNGSEIARSNQDGFPPQWNQTSVGYQEEEELIHPFAIDSVLLNSLLVNGNNVLAVEVHNQSAASSDLSCSPYHFFGFIDSTLHFEPVPEWFVPLGGNGSNVTPPTSCELESNLPIIVVNTQGQNIPDEPKIVALMGIIHNENGFNSTSQPHNHYNGKIGIELRGSSSLYFPKKSYGLEFRTTANEDTSMSVFGMPPEEDWIFQGPYTDKSLLRNVLAYHLSNELGRYASRTQFFELIINDEYLGLYAFMEKIKRDEGRVDIAKLKPDENSGEDLTGGYILKIDKPRGDPGFDSQYPAMGDYYDPNYPIRFLYDYPKAENISPQQEIYIQNYVGDFEDALAGDNFKDPIIGYRKYIDIDSFVDFLILSEVSRNIDGYRISTFFYKDKNAKLNMGPVWDFNFAFGMCYYYQGFSPEGWNFKMYELWNWEDYQFPFWWERLLEDPYFCALLIERWQQLRQNVLSDDAVTGFIDEQLEMLQEPAQRNFEKWPVIGVDIDPNYYTFNSWEEETDYLKAWVCDRMEWIDQNIGDYSAGIREESFCCNISIYPNPSADNFMIGILPPANSNISISIYNILHQPCGSISIPAGDGRKLSFSASSVVKGWSARQAGVYFVEVGINDLNKTFKIIKK